MLSDGDAVFQPRKVRAAGLWEAVEGRVLIYVHKEQMLGEVEQRYPAAHYVLVDDKVRILEAVKQAWGDAVTTRVSTPGTLRPRCRGAGALPAADLTLRTSRSWPAEPRPVFWRAPACSRYAKRSTGEGYAHDVIRAAMA